MGILLSPLSRSVPCALWPHGFVAWPHTHFARLLCALTSAMQRNPCTVRQTSQLLARLLLVHAFNAVDLEASSGCAPSRADSVAQPTLHSEAQNTIILVGRGLVTLQQMYCQCRRRRCDFSNAHKRQWK